MEINLAVNVCSMSYESIKKGLPLIQNLSFSQKSGEFSSFIGPSGAGKTTLLRIISGLEQRYEGLIELNGEQIKYPSRRVQIVFQDNRLLPWKTVYENIEFSLNNNHIDGHALITKWLSNVRLSDKAKNWPKTLSGGEESRVAIARAFIDPPAVLLLDEPFLNLDIKVRYEIEDMLLDFLKGLKTTTILVSHNIEDAVYMSDYVYLLSKTPMKILEKIAIDIPRPRKRDDSRMLSYMSTIINKLNKLDNF